MTFLASCSREVLQTSRRKSDKHRPGKGFNKAVSHLCFAEGSRGGFLQRVGGSSRLHLEDSRTGAVAFTCDVQVFCTLSLFLQAVQPGIDLASGS